MAENYENDWLWKENKRIWKWLYRKSKQVWYSGLNRALILSAVDMTGGDVSTFKLEPELEKTAARFPEKAEGEQERRTSLSRPG